MIDAEFVRYWSQRYPIDATEADLFGEVHSQVAERGCFTRDEFLTVGRWKSPRPLWLMRHNSDEEVELVTRAALAVPAERFRVWLLQALDGVAEAMASALLTVWNPEAYTVTDWRAKDTLRVYGLLSAGEPQYEEYLAICRKLALRTKTDLRSVDRALWQYSRENGTR